MIYIAAILILEFIIITHELGHMKIAKIFGINTKGFFIGMGPVLFKKKIKDTTYAFKLLPLGGACDLSDEVLKISRIKQIIIYLAGCIVNFITGTLSLFLACFLARGPKGLYMCPDIILYIITLPFNFVNYVKNTPDAIQIVGVSEAVKGMGDNMASQTMPVSIVICVALGIFSIIMAYINLIPIPPMDGGQILFTILEKFWTGFRKIRLVISFIMWILFGFITWIAIAKDFLFLTGFGK